MRFFLITTLLITTILSLSKIPLLYAEEPVSPETISVGGKTLAELRQMAGIEAPSDVGSILFVPKVPETSSIEAFRESLRARMEVVLHNLLNDRTVGYKRLVPIVVEVKNTQTGQLLGGRIAEFRTDFSQGPIVKTDRPLDWAIKGAGFFVLRDTRPDAPESGNSGENKEDPDRKLLFTRRGTFSLDPTGTLGLRCGEQFYPLEPKIILSKPTDPVLLDEIQLQTFADRSLLVRLDEGLFSLPENGAPLLENTSTTNSGVILSGMLEFSNVDQAVELQEWDILTKLRKEIGLFSDTPKGVDR